mmetsp:Transcript_4797/g.11969  ORF Transcript_4797/g.11969 Transcript_4797/m.11969 type:complete len:202 (-) Transcript_4797:760-1365(-)
MTTGRVCRERLDSIQRVDHLPHRDAARCSGGRLQASKRPVSLQLIHKLSGKLKRSFHSCTLKVTPRTPLQQRRRSCGRGKRLAILIQIFSARQEWNENAVRPQSLEPVIAGQLSSLWLNAFLEDQPVGLLHQTQRIVRGFGGAGGQECIQARIFNQKPVTEATIRIRCTILGIRFTSSTIIDLVALVIVQWLRQQPEEVCC